MQKKIVVGLMIVWYCALLSDSHPFFLLLKWIILNIKTNLKLLLVPELYESPNSIVPFLDISYLQVLNALEDKVEQRLWSCYFEWKSLWPVVKGVRPFVIEKKFTTLKIRIYSGGYSHNKFLKYNNLSCGRLRWRTICVRCLVL